VEGPRVVGRLLVPAVAALHVHRLRPAPAAAAAAAAAAAVPQLVERSAWALIPDWMERCWCVPSQLALTGEDVKMCTNDDKLYETGQLETVDIFK
jgi:hypothetical protein